VKENLTEVIVGAAVLVAAGAFLAYAAQATGFSRGGDSIDLTASFRSVEGITTGSDVRMAGVKIGTVSAMSLDPQTFRARTTLTLDAAIPIPDDSSAVIASEGLLGGAFVEIVPGGSLTELDPGAEIVDTQGAVSLLNLLLTYLGGDKTTTP
jgi:phospholipid/cholesterol/gamma-HCH transport system substrate-binding protein